MAGEKRRTFWYSNKEIRKENSIASLLGLNGVTQSRRVLSFKDVKRLEVTPLFPSVQFEGGF